MRDSYGEGVASHTGPESCGGGREVVIEALTGESAGWVWSSEILNVRDADALMSCGRPHRAKRQRELGTGPAESKTPKGGFASLCTHRSNSQGRRSLPRREQALCDGSREIPDSAPSLVGVRAVNLRRERRR
jgi:hypothetical protein